MIHHLRLAILLLSIFPASCVNLGTAEQRQVRIHKLSREIGQLSPTIDTREADKLAFTAVESSADLAREFKPVPVAWVNNNFVNSGLRKRGLCYHWREDLFPHLYALKLKTIDLHLASARRATRFEHNCIVITARGQRFEDGIALDPWRGCGVLAWAKVSEDRYPWQPLPRDFTPDVLRPLLMPELYPPQ